MKILIVSQYFVPENFKVNDLALAWQQAGHEVEVLTGLPNYPDGVFAKGYSHRGPFTEVWREIKISRVWVWPRGRGFVNLAANYLSFMLVGSCGIWKMKKFSPDIVFIWNTSPIFSAVPAVLFAKALGLPSAMWIQDLWPQTFYGVLPSFPHILRRPLAWICRKIYQNVDFLWLQSQAYRASLFDQISGSDLGSGRAERLFYLPNWGDFTPSSQALAERYTDRKKGSEEFVCLYAGNVGRAQNLEIFVYAAEKLKSNPQIKFHILGDGSDKERLKSLVNKLNLQETVRFFPRVAAEDAALQMQSAQVGLLSLGNEIAFQLTVPSKLQAYMSNGLPVVASISGEGKRVIHESGCGLVAEADDLKGLIKNVLTLYQGPRDNLSQMSKNGYRYYQENFSRQRVLEKSLELLNQHIVSATAEQPERKAS